MGNYQVRFGGERVEKELSVMGKNLARRLPNYFHDDKPVFAFIENDGMGKKGDASEAKGDKFYFGSEGLIAFLKADGNKVDASSEEFKKYNEKLIREANAFRGIVK